MVRCWAFGPLFRVDLGDVAQVEHERVPRVCLGGRERAQIAGEHAQERVLAVDASEPGSDLFVGQERRRAF